MRHLQLQRLRRNAASWSAGATLCRRFDKLYQQSLRNMPANAFTWRGVRSRNRTCRGTYSCCQQFFRLFGDGRHSKLCITEEWQTPNVSNKCCRSTFSRRCFYPLSHSGRSTSTDIADPHNHNSHHCRRHSWWKQDNHRVESIGTDELYACWLCVGRNCRLGSPSVV